MSDTDDCVTTLGLSHVIDNLLSQIDEILSDREDQILDVDRVDLCLCLRSVNGHYTDLCSARQCKHNIWRKETVSILVEDVGAKSIELCVRQILLELLDTEVEVVVSKTDKVIRDLVHHFDGRCTL